MWLRILVIFSLFLISSGYAQQVSVRYGSYPDKERIVLDLGGRVDYRVILLENPKRIVLDLMNSDIQIKDHPKVKTRGGKHPWGTRVVIERDFSDVKSFSLEEPFRIVLDVYTGKMEDKKTQEAIVLKEDDPLVAILDPKVLSVILNDREKGVVVAERKGGRFITQKRTIVIDPGHGGHDPGAIGFMGIKEKDVNLEIARKLAQYLKEDGRFNVIMTRDRDVFITLQERARIALRNRADLFISIHANASPKGVSSHAKGTYIFAISSEAAQRKKEQIVKNGEYSQLVLGGADVPLSARVVLADLAMDVTLYEGVNFARKVSLNLSRNLSRDVEFKGIQRAGFAVLKTPGIPSVLVEVGFITNPEEALLMNSKEFQSAFAENLYKSIVDYFFPEPVKKLTLNR